LLAREEDQADTRPKRDRPSACTTTTHEPHSKQRTKTRIPKHTQDNKPTKSPQANTPSPSQLGIPTANIPISGLSVGGHSDVASGVYYGWAGLSPSPATSNKSAVFPMVMSIGWNPFYKNTVRSVEVHIMHDFEQDFYGSHMNLVILGFIRPEYDYVSLESLVEDIRTDIQVSKDSLEREAYAKFKDEKSLLEFGGKSEVAS
jgi:riboflavin kinase